MRPQSLQRVLFAAVFLLAISLRLLLAGFNREANDAHETVAKIILASHKLPTRDDCWECFQPKLFHLIFAAGIKAAGMENQPGYRQNIVGQAVNFLLSIVALGILWLFIRGLSFGSARLKILAFALVALNPALIGINSQATNDTFLLLFSTLAFFCAYRFLQHRKFLDLLFTLLASLLAVSSKTNGWVTVCAITMAFATQKWMEKGEGNKRYMLLPVTFLIAVVSLSIVNPLNQYILNWQKYGSPVLLNIEPEPLPPFWGKPTSDSANGIWYIGDGFFTFKFLSLLRHPRLEVPSSEFLPHQTSFWTILYGRAHSVNFDNTLPSWSTSGTTLFALTRSIFIFALLPTLFLLCGAMLEITLLVKGICQRKVSLLKTRAFGLFAFAFVGYFLFEVLYALLYRSITVIKAIFLYPAILSFAYLFLRWLEYFYARCSRRSWLLYLFEANAWGLVLVYAADVSTLIARLAQAYLLHHGGGVF